MKKNLFILAAAGVALASCSSDDLISENAAAKASQPQEIALTALTQPNTRAAVTNAVFPDQDMYVAAYQATATAGDYFGKTVYKKNYAGGALKTTADNIWGGVPARFWPLSAATINFLAVTGGNMDAAHFSFNDTQNFASSATVAYTSANSYSSDTQYDIMYAVGQGVVTQTNNTLSFNGGGTTSAENVKMVFKHALALLNFQVKANSTTEVNRIKVNSITINGASYTGTLAITNSSYNATTAPTQPKIVWTPTASEADAVVPNLSNYTIVSSTDWYPANTAGTASTWANIMIVPSDTKGDTPTQRGFLSFTINYTVLANGVDGATDQTYNYVYYPSGNSSNAFYVHEGKIYTFKINFKLHEIRIEPSVTEWTAPTSYPKEITIQD